MRLEPLNLEQALALSGKYQHLVGKEFITEDGAAGIIEAVAISPFDDINKWIFLEFYKESRSVKKALEYYQYPYYDVLIITKTEPGVKPLFEDIRTYCRRVFKNEIPEEGL